MRWDEGGYLRPETAAERGQAVAMVLERAARRRRAQALHEQRADIRQRLLRQARELRDTARRMEA